MHDDCHLGALQAAHRLLDPTSEPVEACRTLVRALHRCGPEIAEHPAAVVLRGFDSETETFPVGQQRDSWNPHELARLDCEREDYWRQVGSEVRRACAELVAVLEQKVTSEGTASKDTSK